MVLSGMFIMVYNLWRTVRPQAAATQPAIATA